MQTKQSTTPTAAEVMPAWMAHHVREVAASLSDVVIQHLDAQQAAAIAQRLASGSAQSRRP